MKILPFPSDLNSLQEITYEEAKELVKNLDPNKAVGHCFETPEGLIDGHFYYDRDLKSVYLVMGSFVSTRYLIF